MDGDWHLFCPGGVQDTHLTGCVAAIRVRSEEDPAQWVRVGFSFPPPGRYPKMEFLVPSTTIRHDGISLGVDGYQIGIIPIASCGASGCMAPVNVDARLLDRLGPGDIQVEYQVGRDSDLRHSLPAAGLDAYIRRSGIKDVSRRRDE